MDVGTATVYAAVIAGLGYIIASMISFRRENRDDHAKVRNRLDNIDGSVRRVETKVERVEDKIDSHIVDHAKGAV